MSKKVAVIIVSHNGRHHLPDCLASVFNSDYPKENLKVIVIDNNSADSAVGYLKEVYPEVKIVENKKNHGFAEANNQGFFLAKKWGADYLLLLNQDAIMEKNCLPRLVKLIESDETIAAVQPKILLYPEKDKINSLGNSIHFLGFAYCNYYKEKDQQGITQPFETPYSSGAACLLRVSAIDEVGFFDDRLFMYHEDVDLGWRLRLAGYKSMLNPLAVIYHKYNYRKAKYKFYYMERNRWIVMLQNYRLATLLIFSPALLVMELGIILFSLKNGWFKEKIKGCLWILSRWPSIMSHRLNVRFKTRKIKDRQILALFTGSIRFQEIDNP
ncbi:MAG: glycosyltransferase family 2 protein, partial [Patescibacteria group bacterium]